MCAFLLQALSVSPMHAILTATESTALHAHAVLPYPARRSAVLPGRHGHPAVGDGGLALSLAEIITVIRAGGPLTEDVLRTALHTCLRRLHIFALHVQSDASHFLEKALECLCVDFNVNTSLMRTVITYQGAGPNVLADAVTDEWVDLAGANHALFSQMMVCAACIAYVSWFLNIYVD